MSEVIVWMEMPTGCPHCPMADDDSRFCKATKKYIPMLCKPSWCPIKGVLPDEHGDLIDRDKAKDAFDSSFLTFRMKDGETMRGFYQRTIAELTTVIAAERKDDGTTAD